MRGKMRFAAICGIVLIFGASAVAVGKRARQADKDKAKVEAVDRDAPQDKAAPEPVVSAVAGTPKIEVKCNIPPITVNTAAAPLPPSDQAAPGKRSRTKGALFDWSKIGRDLVLTLIFSLLGLAIALFGYFVYHWVVPFDLRKELEIDQNTSLGIVAGSIILGLCIIVAAAIASPS